MLRITTLHDQQTLKLDGKIRGQWAQLLESECRALLGAGQAVHLDCAGLTYTDEAGLEVVRRFQEQGVEVVYCPPLI